MPTLRDIIIELGIMVAIGLVLAAIGPYGSFAMGGYATRLAYWVPAALGGYAIVRPVTVLCTAAAARLDLPLPAALTTGVLLAAAPLTLFIRWLGGNDPGGRIPLEGWFQLYLQVALIGGAVTLFFYLVDKSQSAQASASSSNGGTVAELTEAPMAQPVQEPVFLGRLPPHLREGLRALEMEDHYVRTHSRHGSTLILMRMRDAVAELAGIDGLQVHRSWWVAKSAVKSVTRDGRVVLLDLGDGLRAPVSRNSLPALREAGWLGDERDVPGEQGTAT